MSENVKIVDECDLNKFMKKCQELLDAGYKISSTACTVINSEEYNFCSQYQAILIKEAKCQTK